MTKIYWVSRHQMNREQLRAIKDLFGEIDVHWDDIIFQSPFGLIDYIEAHKDGKVFAVAAAIHYLQAMDHGCEFYIFEREENKSLKSIWHVNTKEDSKDVEGDRLAEIWTSSYKHAYRRQPVTR